MPALGSLIIALVAGLAEFFVMFVTKKIAFGLAAVTALSVITVALFVALRSILAAVAVGISDPMVLMGIGIGIPNNAGVCILSIVNCWCACTLYSWQRKALTLFATVS
jgi:hypothetical protein